jgi:undecaprenyl-diphosphatase
MEILKTLLLGIIQGLTEFLPVSSSGHLIIAQTFMGVDSESGASGSSMLLEVALHVATGIAVLFVFRKDIINIICGCFAKDTTERKGSLTYSGRIILATVPAALVGILLNDRIDALFDTKGNTAAYVASFMLFVTAGLLIFSSKKKRADTDNDNTNSINVTGIDAGGLTTVRAILIGVTQAIAIMPGISRSGSTIAIALIIGVTREEAGRFSFMLALPAIFGAALLQARHIESWGALASMDIAAGFIASLIVGIIALKFLLTFIKKGKLHWFGYYCAAAAVASLTLLTFIKR